MMRWLLLWVSAGLLTGCLSMTRVRPLPQGVLAVEAAAALPSTPAVALPPTSVGVAYGVTEGLSIHAHLQPSPLPFGAIGGDVGLTGLLLEQQGVVPALTAAAQVHAFAYLRSPGGPGFMADAALTASWLLGEQWLPYATLAAQVQLHDGATLLTPGAGLQLLLGSWTLQAEVRLAAVARAGDRERSPFFPENSLGGLVIGGAYRFGP